MSIDTLKKSIAPPRTITTGPHHGHLRRQPCGAVHHLPFECDEGIRGTRILIGMRDLRLLTQTDLDKAAHQLNGRSRQILGWMTPPDKLAETMQ
jgi:hypothetical protein